MEVQLQELVEKIKQDGVQQARTQASEIIETAKKDAEKIIAAAHEQSAALVKKAEEEAKRFEKASVSAVQQASRNTLLAFRDSIAASLDKLVHTETNRAYDAAVLKTLIPNAVTEWIKKNGEGDVSILLSKKDADTLGESFFALLKKDVDKGIELKTSTAVDAGFRIGTKDGAAYYDFSADAVADLFSIYLSSRAALILKDAAKEL